MRRRLVNLIKLIGWPLGRYTRLGSHAHPPAEGVHLASIVYKFVGPPYWPALVLDIIPAE